MKVVSHYDELESRQFEGETVKGVRGRIAVGMQDGAPHFCMRIFTLAPGGFTPRHSHDWEHEILVHAGSGQVLSSGAWVDISTGSVVFIPGNEQHQLRNNSEADLVFACLIPQGVPEL